jgi:hypothetical protein
VTPRRLLAALLLLAAVSGCNGGDGTSGAGGGGGIGEAGAGGGDPVTSGGGTGGGSSACASCPDVYNGIDPALLCVDGEPSSKGIFDDLVQCTCAVACSAECADNMCLGLAITETCSICLDPQHLAEKCPAEVTQCVNDK